MDEGLRKEVKAWKGEGEWEGRERRNKGNEGSEAKEMEFDEVKEGEKVVEEREVEENGGGSEAGRYR